MQNYEKVYVSNNGIKIKAFYPYNSLDLFFQDNATIYLIIDSPHIYEKIKLNKDSDYYLECEDLERMKKCLVPLSHFEAKNRGYY